MFVQAQDQAIFEGNIRIQWVGEAVWTSVIHGMRDILGIEVGPLEDYWLAAV